MATADAVNTIAESLKETDELPRKQITEIVDVLGAEASLALLAETRRVQDEGGLAVRDGTRKRTDGGVFFSLAKAQLPKADRNRIFRIRPPRSPESERREAEAREAEAATNGSGGPASEPLPAPDTSRVAGPPAQSNAAGRRRVVEVEVLRTFPKAQKEERPQMIAPRPSPEPPPRASEEKREELRPLRRIVTVATPREEAPATPDAARERIRALLKGLKPEDQRRVISDLARELGVSEGAPRVAAARDADAPPVDDRTRERVLAAVTDALGLGTADLAQVLYGDDSPGTKSKARLALDRFRKSQGR